MNEKHIEQTLKHAVEEIGGICWKLVCPGTIGVPERICLMKSRIVFVELKTPDKKPRQIQAHRMNQLRQQGFTTLVVDLVDGIREVLDALRAA